MGRNTRPTWVEVDLLQFAYNLEAIAAHVEPAEMMPVVKANAYGHGDVELSRIAMDLGYQALAVAIIDEAVMLRRGGIAADLLVLGYTPAWQVGIALEEDIALTVIDQDMLGVLQREAGDRGLEARIHVKVETGMNRIGVRPGPDLARLLEELKGHTHIRIEGVFTHFAAADEDPQFTKEQIKQFRLAWQMVEDAGFTAVCRHAANSAGILDFPQAHLDMVRPGLIMYGYYPSATVGRPFTVRPPLRWLARMVQVKTLRKGDTVGYNRTYRAESTRTVASLPVGYADGYPRILSNRGTIYVEGQPAPVVGRVCMDQLMIDVTDLPGAKPGAICSLLGPEHDASDMGRLAQTIPHEILTGISPRVPRLYHR